MFLKHKRFSSLLVTRASFEARVGEGRGSKRCACVRAGIETKRGRGILVRRTPSDAKTTSFAKSEWVVAGASSPSDFFRCQNNILCKI